MSIELFIEFSRDIFIPSINKSDVQKEQTNLWTGYMTNEDALRIYKAGDQFEEYFKFIRSVTEHTEPFDEPIFADDDWFCEKEPISYKRYIPAETHIAELKNTLRQYEAKGYIAKITY
jgi:hypothetical protein